MEHLIAEIVGKMHIHKITQTALAEHMGIRRDYISRILSGGVHPKGTAEKIAAAVDEMIGMKS